MNDKSEDPLSAFMEINCLGTLNLAKQAAKAGVKRFVFLSSIKVNGEKTDPRVPFKFDDIPMTNDAYGISKAEAGLLAIAANTKLEVVIIRPPLVYGPGVKANFHSLTRVSQKNLPLPLGAVNNKRSFIALDNLVDLINICVDHPDSVNKVFLVSDDSDISTSGLLKVMANSFGHKARLLNISPALSRKGLSQLFY
jgi:nucleoside-diphosphate-sugar epimerase